MKKNTFLKIVLLLVIVSIKPAVVCAQIKNDFNVRFQTTVRGDLTVISNNILNRSPNPNTDYNATGNASEFNDLTNMQYIDVDGSNETFSSSSATLNLADADCSNIVHAGLYWSATYKYNLVDVPSSGRENDWNQVKFRVPGGNYVNITANEVLYNAFGNPNQINVAHSPYACYADVTSLVSALANPNGTYFVGNVRASVNQIGNQTSSISGGLSAGWTLVIVYENIKLPGRKITTFDGYAVIASGAGNLDIPVSGFATLPAPFPVRAKLGISSLEGDNKIPGDQLQLKADLAANFTNITNTPPPTAPVANNFFNSSITVNNAFFNARNPNSLNTLGWDAHLNPINNPANSVIPNNETGVTLRASSTQDKYDVFFTSFDVEIIEPQIPLLKKVENTAGIDVNNQALALGQEIFYTLTFQNLGNDAAQNFTITDVLPTNAIFPPNGTIQPGDLILPPGVTYVFDAVLNKFTFTIPNNLVEIGDPSYTIKIKVKLPSTCQDFRDACSNNVINQAFVSYNGVLNSQVITDNPSFSGYDSCNYPTPGTTNFIADIDDCVFTRTEVLCGNTLNLTAPNGYSTYLWQNAAGVTIGNTQTITVTATGTYTVFLSIPPPCVSIFETVNVVDFNNAIGSNPAIPYANVVETCPNDGSLLPKIFLCGEDDSVLIESGVNNAVSIVWQQLVPGSCVPVGVANCANTNQSCIWNTVATGPNYNVTNAGEYRVIFTYQNGCFRQFYFNVFENSLNPTIVSSNIICTSQGSITINNLPSNYEISLSPNGPFQTANTFVINAPGVYTVYIRQIGVINGCVFEFPNINIQNQVINVDVIVTNKICNTGFGSIRVQINGVEPQYSFQIRQGSTIISSFGPSNDNDHLFTNLNPGTYTVTATTNDGCVYTEQVTIEDLSNLNLIATVAKHIDCNPGSIILNATGGLAPYNYAIYSFNGVLVNPANYVYQTNNDFEILNGLQGTYQFIVIDNNNCSSLSNTVTVNLEPSVNVTETHTNITCNGLNNGTITVTALPINGYTISYSINNGTSFQSSNVFTNLNLGTYTILVRYTKGTSICEYTITATISEPPILTAQSQLVQPITCLLPGTIQVINASGGTAPYQYSINGVSFQNNPAFTNLSSGTYTITVKDANNCITTTLPITLVLPLPPTDIAFTASTINCPGLTSNVTTTIIGGVAPYVIQITNPLIINASTITGNVASFNNLTAGTYTFVVTDANNCTYQENFTINPISLVDVTGILVSNVSCFNGTNGAVLFSVSEFSTSYSYSINGATPVTNQTNNTINLTNLAAGTYSIVVTDTTTNCLDSVSITVGQPSEVLSLSLSSSPITCIANGSITATAAGGWGAYSYAITLPNATIIGPQNTGVFNNLNLTGNYIISVTDANGCVVSSNITLNPVVNPALTISNASSLCISSTTGATVVLNATLGVAPYQYSINNSAFQSSNIFSGLLPGTYTFTVKDSFGCTATVLQTIANQLIAQSITSKNLDCSASPDAMINININGGTPNYQYQININNSGFGALTPIIGTSISYTTANPGNYQFLITDSAGCTFTTNTITINPITNPQITSITQTQQNLCNGDTNAAIQVNIDANLGTAPFQYSINGGVTYQNSNVFTNLAAGTYNIIVRDSKLCLDNDSITIVQPDLIDYDFSITDITCNNPGGTNYGEIIIQNVTGGTAPYTYILTNNFGYNETYDTISNENHTFIILDFGIYTAEVIDSNGCSIIQNNIIIASPPNDLDIQISSIVTDCILGGTATVSVSSLVSSGSYEFGILETNIIPYTTTYQPADSGTPQTATFTGLVPGVTYTFVVHDLITNCYYFETATSPVPTTSNVLTTINTVANVSCTGSADGTISFAISNYDLTTTSITYEIFNAQSNISTGLLGTSATTGGIIVVQNFGTLPPGIYYLLLTENGGSFNGCSSATQNFSITQSTNQLLVTASLIANDNCNFEAGIVTATAQFGTAPYEFMILPSSSIAPTVTTWNGSSINTFNLESGSYIVYVKDANNCIVASAVVPVALDPSPEIMLSIVDNCALEGSFEINVIRTQNGIAPYTYTVDNGSSFTENAANFIVSNLVSGNHVITITDANGCSFTQNITINPIINGSALVTLAPSCANNDGEIQATAVNGSGNYSFELQNTLGTTLAGPNSTGLFTGLGFGTYNVIISDVTDGCSFTIPLTLEEPNPVIFTTNQQNISCNGANDGSITVLLDTTNIDTPYTFSLFNGTTIITQNTPVFTNLVAGNYTLTVTSSKNCLDTQTIAISQPNALAFSLNSTNFNCNPNNTLNAAIITATVDNGFGTAPYLYSIDGINFQNDATFTVIDNGNVQNFTITVKDANGCLSSESITINPLPIITNVAITQNTALTCTSDEEVLLTVVGGSGNYTYQQLPGGVIIGPTTNNTALFLLQNPGTYTFEIVDVTTGCSFITAPYTINPLPVLNVVADGAVGVSCFDDTNGAFNISVTGYTGTYSYQIFNSTNPIPVASGTNNTSTNPLTLNNLAAGNYTVQISSTQSPFCQSITNSITIESPAIPLSLDIQQTAAVTCNVPGLGTITAQGTGGSGTLVYQLINNATNAIIVPFSANSTFSNLSAGTYRVIVRDANLCETAQTITLDAPEAILATYSLTNQNLLCYNDTNASVTITATGGQGSYQYVLTNANGIVSGPQIFNVFSGLGAGTYTITVSDGWDCNFTTLPFIISQPLQIEATLSVNNPLTCDNNAQLIVTASGGTPPYQYSNDGINYNSTNTFLVGPGTYQYFVTDANGCSAIQTNAVTIAPITPLQIVVDATNTSIQCNGDTNASIAVTVSGGLGNYNYSLLNAGSLNVLSGPQSSNIFSGLGAGSYIVSVNSGDCDANSNVITITQPTIPLSITNYTVFPSTCNGNQDGRISLFPVGGTPPYQYAITTQLDQFFNTNTFNNLSVGSYTILVQDANGCFETINVNITEPDVLNATAVNTFEVCEGSNNGTTTLTITGGTAPYFTSLDTDNSNNFIQGQLQFNNLDSTIEHTIYIKDTNDCQFVLTIPMGNPVVLNPTVDAIQYGCTTRTNLQNNSITINVEAFNIGQVQFSLDNQTNYQSSNVYTNLSNGLHTIYVRHNNGCIKTVTVNITNWLPLEESHVKVDVLCYGDTNGSITVTATGGIPSYLYAISPQFTFGTVNTFNNLPAGTYTVKIKDSENCEIETNPITILQPTPLNLSINPNNVGQDICLGDNFGYFQVDITGGVPPYFASFNNSTNYQAVDAVLNSVIYENLSGGATYTVYVRDANGCESTIQQVLDPAIDLNPEVEVVYDCSNNTSTNTVTITVESIYVNDVLYSIDGINYQTSNVFVNVAAGSYTVFVDHSNGCLNSSETFTIDQINPLLVSVVETGLNQITATATGGVPPYTYVFNGVNTGTNNVYVYSQTGNQSVVVYDANGCEVNTLFFATFYPIEIPNFFTPDNNGFNDFWTPKNIENYTNLESLIFDRYGRLIKRLRVGETWDGNYESMPLPSGDYWYLVNVNDGSGRAFTGNFTLYR